MQLLPLVSLALALLSYASPTSDANLLDLFGPHTTKHAWVNTPVDWEHKGPAPDNHTIRLKIALKQSNIDSLIEQLYQVSDPDHERYGMHLSKEEVEQLVKPSQESVDHVENWLSSHGLDLKSPKCGMQKSPAGDWISVNVPVRLAEQMLDTNYNVYQHREDPDNRVVRTLSYSLPRSLHDHIDVITPTTMFGSLRRMKATSFVEENSDSNGFASIQDGSGDEKVRGPSGLPVSKSCNTKITPECLMDLYATRGYKVKAAEKNSIGIAGYLEEFATFDDLKLFTAQFRPDAKDATFKVVQFNGGGNNQSDPGVEANLDIQTTIGLTFPTPNTYFSTGGRPPFNPDQATPTNTNEPYEVFVENLLKESSIPHVISTSYGDDEQTVPEDYAKRVCATFAQLGARGTSILFSSGDDGVGRQSCLTNDGKNQTIFQPAFPASCPFVTTVGGTINTTENAVAFSGGGFSRYFDRPAYQSGAVKGYLKNLGDKYKGLFNPKGRAYPDVAAQGRNFQIFVGGKVINVGGTSASCPAVSGVVTLLNDARIANGGKPLGFLNPLLYKFPQVLNDVTNGTNPGCGTDGFASAKGWDPVTGLGSPNFLKMNVRFSIL